MITAPNDYRRNDGKIVRIGGRIDAWSHDRPWVWSHGGDWYDENTGEFIFTRIDPYTGKFVSRPLPMTSHRTISDHSPISETDPA